MRPIDIGDIGDIVEKLMDLHAHSLELAQRMAHELDCRMTLPPFLIDRIEASFAACENVTTED